MEIIAIKKSTDHSSMIEEDPKSCTHPLRGLSLTIESDKQEELESAKAKVGKVREENERLKLLLSKIVNDYKSLQMRCFDVLRQDQEPFKQQSGETSLKLDDFQEIYDHGYNHHLDISLCLGRDSKNPKNKEVNKNPKNAEEENERLENKELTLGLGSGTGVLIVPDTDGSLWLENSSTYQKEENKENLSAEKWPLRRSVKNMRSEDNQEEEVLEQHQPSLKKTRVCVRARCNGPTMNDGCQWRKYGQKTAKGNPLPRAYYRCSISPSCPVRKQVQRSAEDISILITTYEGIHDHPLPTEATAMAAATSAAASILKSGSSSSSASLRGGLSHFFPSHDFSISTSNSHPTVTLDLTAPNRKLPNYPSSSTSLNLSSFGPATLRSNILSFNRTFMGFNNGLTVNRQASPSTDSLAAAIASNPSFQTALAAAFTSHAGQDCGSVHQNTWSSTSLPFSAPASPSADHGELRH